MSRIVVIGGINMDLHLFGGRRPSSGATLLVDHYLTQPGGKGSNVARAAARLGARVELVGRVGDDDFGRRCVEATRDDGVDVTAVSTSTTPTGFVAIELDEGRHRTLVFVPGANDELEWSAVEPVLRTVGPDDLVIAQAEVPSAVLLPLAHLAAAGTIQLFLDPAPPERVDAATLRAAQVISPDRARPQRSPTSAASSRCRPWRSTRATRPAPVTSSSLRSPSVMPKVAGGLSRSDSPTWRARSRWPTTASCSPTAARSRRPCGTSADARRP